MIVELNSDSFRIKDRETLRVLLQGKCDNGLYLLPKITTNSGVTSGVQKLFSPCMAFKSCVISADVWHARLGHPSTEVLTRLFRTCNLAPCQKNVNGQCRTCLVSKHHRLPFSLSNTRVLQHFELIHTNIWGPLSVHQTYWPFAFYETIMIINHLPAKLVDFQILVQLLHNCTPIFDMFRIF